ncbi:MAG TPA: D-alanine--D-alanine ligase, partial [Nitrospiria bacterium]|nr:D-alanine--D-alanine ligase [Nitrospiria bacterium]
AFNALHGRGGEDGTIQGLLECLEIPYTGSGVRASAIGMDKALTKKLLEAEGIPTPRSCLAGKQPGEKDAPPALPKEMAIPVVVKPNSEGSTLGISIVKKEDDLLPAIESARRYDDEVLIEEYVEGREMTVGILDGEALPVIEVVPKENFYDYDAKYTKGKTEYRVPAPLSPESSGELQELAVRTHQLLGCRGATRVDFRLDNGGRPFVLEINTVPGMTETSLLPKAAEAKGISYDDLVRRMVLAVPGGNRE